ncbi:hypothetical protein SUGI_0261130 [Cryptomeria japonica]|nr:hypothetical protein SUGI_0261130 [Cryptomeria japonica]
MENLGKSGLVQVAGFLVAVEAHELVKQCIQYYDAQLRQVVYNHRVYADLTTGGFKELLGIPVPTSVISSGSDTRRI